MSVNRFGSVDLPSIVCTKCGEKFTQKGSVETIEMQRDGSVVAKVLFPKWPDGWRSVEELLYCPAHKVEIRRTLIVDDKLVRTLPSEKLVAT